jgi:hypothetical protein
MVDRSRNRRSFNVVHRTNVQTLEIGYEQPATSDMLSAKRATAPSEGDLAVVERLVNEGKLIAVPPGGTAKPRRLAVVALHDGGEILLYLSRATTVLTKE